MRDDAAAFLDAEWIAPRPHSDTALMLALAHTLIVEGLHDADFLARYCAGFNRFRDYLLGAEDGVAKSADWAAGLSEISADKIRALARKMAASRTFINVNWSLQRGDHGEQPVWAAIALASVLGQVGLPGGGFGFGYGSMEGLASLLPDMPIPTLSARPQSGSQLHPGGSNRGPAAQPGSAVPVQRAGPQSIPTSISSIGAAAIRFTIIRISTA